MSPPEWIQPKEKRNLNANWRTMGGLRDVLMPNFSTAEWFEKDVETAAFRQHVCHISYKGECVKEDNDLVQRVTVTWPDGDTESLDLRLFRHKDGTPILANDRFKKATFVEVAAGTPSAGAKGGQTV